MLARTPGPLASSPQLPSPTSRKAATPQTPQTPALRVSLSPIRRPNKPGAPLQLSLRKAIGANVSSVNAFDYDSASSTFAICVGAFAVLHHVDADGNVAQRFLRPPPDTDSQHYASTHSESRPLARTPGRPKRRTSSLRTRLFGQHNHKAASPFSEYRNNSNPSLAKERPRTASCVALSPDGRFAAVGETGHNPRVLLYAISSEGNPALLSVLSDHSQGVSCLSFSPDSAFLCTIGDVHDGFVHVWAVSGRPGSTQPHSVNKCTSFVHDVAWLSDTDFVTVGIRHAKIWRVERAQTGTPPSASRRETFSAASLMSPFSTATLYGRNCVLGSLLELSFLSVTRIAEGVVVIGSECGSLCLLDARGKAPSIGESIRVHFSINSLSFENGNNVLWVAGSSGKMRRFNFEPQSTKLHEGNAKTLDGDVQNRADILAIGTLGENLVAIDTDNSLLISKIQEDGSLCPLEMSPNCSHHSPVQGIEAFLDYRPHGADFMTWSNDGTVFFWTASGEIKARLNIPLGFQNSQLDEMVVNELRQASILPGLLITGDRSGNLNANDIEDPSCATIIRSHSAEVSGISTVVDSQRRQLIASCARDRLVQVFQILEVEDGQDPRLSLLQTIDQHGSSVNCVRFIGSGNTILSASSDRTLIIHTRVIKDDLLFYVPARTITFRNSPVALAVKPGEEGSDEVLVATSDKQIHRYEISSGRPVGQIRLTDFDDSVSACDLCVDGNNPKLGLVFASCSDKSIRAIDISNGQCLLTEYAHSESVSAVVVIPGHNADGLKTVVSVSHDGAVLLWSLTSDHRDSITSDRGTPSPTHFQNTLATPLRRVISKSLIADFSRSLQLDSECPSRLAPGNGPTSPSRTRRNLPNTKSRTVPRRGLTYVDESDSSEATGTQVAHPLKRPGLDRVRSMGNLPESVPSEDDICRILRSYREKLRRTTEDFDIDRARELEVELEGTFLALRQQRAHGKRDHRSTEGDVFNLFSARIAQMVEDKVAEEMVKQKNSGSSHPTNHTGIT